jgi:hypothetical protein
MSLTTQGAGAHAALLVAHPGHELRIFGWVERMRPLTFVITDGSGSEGEGRISSSITLLERAGARLSSVLGRLTDREIYARMLDGEETVFIGLVDEIAEALVAARVDHLVTDAAEGYNPSHDVCRIMGAAAARLASRLGGRRIEHYDFLLVGRPGEVADDGGSLCMQLGDEALARKVAAAREYVEMRAEVEGALARFGEEAFRTEVLRRAEGSDPTAGMESAPPYYETYGAQQVAAGRYSRVLRYREHFRPVARAIWAHVDARTAQCVPLTS